MRTLALVVLLLSSPWLAEAAHGKKEKNQAETAAPASVLDAAALSGLRVRAIGPALTSGRIADLAVDPTNPKRWFVAAASGGVWKTENGGTTFTPLFDDQPSYSIGCVTLDPSNPHVVWVGTGENNSQRSVGYGDGVYKSVDGGGTWTRMGLAESEHIGMIAVDPRDGDTVWVAAQGPLWSAGGDRGLYKTTDGGAQWTKVLGIDEHTGVSEVWLDPRDPDTAYAVAYQRRRHVWTLIDGGPGSGLHKTTDGGASWTKLTTGLPKGELGRIGLALSPVDPDVLYAVVEASDDDDGGLYRSTDRGASWHRRSGYVTGSPQYYQELVPDPRDVDRVYAMDTFMQVSEDGGESFGDVGDVTKHVDNHALWIDPSDTDHLLAGCDGGLYESYDRGATWRFFANLPLTQFYKIDVDDREPVYHVYGGTQDNFTLGGPARTTNDQGITNADWFVTVGGDGFQPRVDREHPDIIYAQSQNGGLVRFDKRSGEILDIQPQPAAGEDPSRWNWDAPLIISPHDPARLYYGSQRLWRSDDRGQGWRPVSDDLTRQLDRNQLEVMGRIWPIDAVSKNRSTSFYGNIVALSESPRVEGLLYVGTDDGLVQVSEDGGATWRREARFPGVPERTYVNRLEASLHVGDRVYGGFNNHKMGDFTPYLLRSDDRGRSWRSIAGDPEDGGLPARGSVYALAEDHENPDLLFVGTEFGVYVTFDGGGRWLELGGLPTVAVRDLAIQRRQNDLVIGTFGRGFYVLDDYTPLRELAEPAVQQAGGHLFEVPRTWMYIPSLPLGLPGVAFQGDGYFAAPNPPFGAVFTYRLAEALEGREARRKAATETAVEKGEAPPYPTWDELRAEAREDPPAIVLTVRDAAGGVVRRLEGPAGAGIHRVAWDLRFAPADPARAEPFVAPNVFVGVPIGPMAVPGTYEVTLSKRIDGVEEVVGAPRSFEAVALGTATLGTDDREALLAFQQRTARLQRAAMGASEAAAEAAERLVLVEAALRDTPAAAPELRGRARALRGRLADLVVALEGDAVVARRSEPTAASVLDRIGQIVFGHWTATSAPTATHQESYRVAAEAFAPVLEQLRTLIETDLAGLERDLEAAGGPWTPGRVPRWSPE